jgi:hypothetical protein
MGIVKTLGILLAAEILVFLLGCVIFFVIGASSGGINNGFNLVAGVFFYWYAWATLGLIVGVVCSAIALIKGK